MSEVKPGKAVCFVEALYDPESGKTIVRHPHEKDEKVEQWIDTALLAKVMAGDLPASYGIHVHCDIFAVAPHEKQAAPESPKESRFFITYQSSNCFKC